MPMPIMPKTFNFGAGELVELEYLCQTFEIPRRTAGRYLKALRIEPMFFKKKTFFSLTTFRRIMFVLSLPGSPGFLFPGSSGKNNPRHKGSKKYISEVTDEILARAAAPGILAEMNAAEGRDISLLKKFITPSAGRPKREGDK